MKIEIQSTDHITELDGVPVRLWTGKTELGIACNVFVHLIAVNGPDTAEFAAELLEKLQGPRNSTYAWRFEK